MPGIASVDLAGAIFSPRPWSGRSPPSCPVSPAQAPKPRRRLLGRRGDQRFRRTPRRLAPAAAAAEASCDRPRQPTAEPMPATRRSGRSTITRATPTSPT